MPVKRRNHGRNKNNRGYVKTIVCVNCGRLCPKIKPSNASPLETLLMPHLKRILNKTGHLKPTSFPNSTSRCSTVLDAEFTQEL